MKYNYAFNIAFSVVSEHPTGEDVTAEQVREALIKRVIQTYDSGELLEAIGAPFDTYEVALATDRIEEALQSWIDRVAYIPERNNIQEWVSHAEDIANNRQSENQDIVIEMRGIATATGRPETLTLDPKDFDFITLKEEV